MAVRYYTEDTVYRFAEKRTVSAWIEEAASEEGFSTGDITVIFCSDEYLLQMNRDYLGHDYLTDIITFDYGDPAEHEIGGDLFISVDTVRANASRYGVSARQEMLRVVIHGVLHLCGYGDKTAEEASVMRSKEDFYLARYGNKVHG